MDNIKNFLSDPKKKSLTQLAIYAVFFIFVFIMIGTGKDNDSKNVVVETEKEINKVNSYNYKIDITESGIINTITGFYKDNAYIFDYNGVTYIYKENKTYLNENIIDDVFKIDEYSYANIEKLMEYSESETTYKNSNKVTYRINMTEYISDQLSEKGMYDVDGGYLNLTVEKDTYIYSATFEYENGINIKVYYSNIQ